MSANVEAEIRSLAEMVPANNLRLFGCECCQRLSIFCDELLIDELIEFGLSRGTGVLDKDLMQALRERAVDVYERLYPGYGSPSAKALAFSAAGEVAFTVSSLDAAISAAAFAVLAIATNAAAASIDSDYDSAFELACSSERKMQTSLITK